MGMRDKVLGNPAAVKNLKTAKEALAANQDKTETPEYLARNRAVVEAEKNVPWHRR
jgi:hypothetical protein